MTTKNKIYYNSKCPICNQDGQFDRKPWKGLVYKCKCDSILVIEDISWSNNINNLENSFILKTRLFDPTIDKIKK